MKRLHFPAFVLLAAIVPACAPVGVATAMPPRDNVPLQQADTANQPGSDGWISTTIKQKLSAASDSSQREIHVDTRGGMVRLSGTLPTQADVDRAVNVAASVEGVISVDDSGLSVGDTQH